MRVFKRYGNIILLCDYPQCSRAAGLRARSIFFGNISNKLHGMIGHDAIHTDLLQFLPGVQMIKTGDENTALHAAVACFA